MRKTGCQHLLRAEPLVQRVARAEGESVAWIGRADFLEWLIAGANDHIQRRTGSGFFCASLEQGDEIFSGLESPDLAGELLSLIHI